MDPPKRAILLPPPPQLKKESKTYCFELTLGESNDKTYPEFSWKDLVRDAQNKEAVQKAEKGGTALNPYASDDEDDLKAMAARFEEKYNKTTSGKLGKRKRRAEDYIDRGAGYDVEDPFIDNNDIYDEVVPEDLEPVHGGFYINSGSLDFKEVEVSDCDVDEELEENHKKCKTPPQTSKSTKPCLPKPKKQPAGIVKRRGSSTNSLKEKKATQKGAKASRTVSNEGISMNQRESSSRASSPPAAVGYKKNPAMVILSSSSDTSSTSSDDTTSSDSSDSDCERKKTENPAKNNSNPLNASLATSTVANIKGRLKLKNVPLNPKLHGNRLKLKNVPLNPKLHGNKPDEIVNIQTKKSVSPMSNRDIFGSSQSMSSISGLNIPMGLSGTSMTVSATNVSKPSMAGNSGLTMNNVPVNCSENPKPKKPVAARQRVVDSGFKTANIRISSQPLIKKPRKPRLSSATAVRQQGIKLNAKHGNVLSTVERIQEHYQAQLEALGISPSFMPFPVSTTAMQLTTDVPKQRKNTKKSATVSGSAHQNFSQLGSGITVTEVQDKTIRPPVLSPQVLFNTSATGNNPRTSTPPSFSTTTNISIPSSITITSPFPLKGAGHQEGRGSSLSRKTTLSIPPPTTSPNTQLLKPQHITPYDVSALLAHSTGSSNSKPSDKTMLAQNPSKRDGLKK